MAIFFKKIIRLGMHCIRRYLVFRFKLFRAACNPSLLQNKSFLSSLVFYWDNGWSAEEDYLLGIVNFLKKNPCNVLECGSGLTTLIVGVLLQDKNVLLVSFENDRKWFHEMNWWLKKLGLRNVSIQYLPVKDYVNFDWYDAEATTIQVSGFGCVICDGPPGSTRGGRYGLLPIMKDRLNDQATIFLDDAARLGEKEVLRKWKNEFSISEPCFYGKKRLYACVTFKKN